EDGAVVPATGADKQLQGAALLAGQGGDGFGGLALQAGELAAQHGQGMVALLGAVEQGEVALGEGGQAVGAGADGVGGNFGDREQGPGVGVVEDVHGGLHKDTAVQCSRDVSCRLESSRTVELSLQGREYVKLALRNLVPEEPIEHLHANVYTTSYGGNG